MICENESKSIMNTGFRMVGSLCGKVRDQDGEDHVTRRGCQVSAFLEDVMKQNLLNDSTFKML